MKTTSRGLSLELASRRPKFLIGNPAQNRLGVFAGCVRADQREPSQEDSRESYLYEGEPIDGCRGPACSSRSIQTISWVKIGGQNSTETAAIVPSGRRQDATMVGFAFGRVGRWRWGSELN